jgi:hypothetical protein
VECVTPAEVFHRLEGLSGDPEARIFLARNRTKHIEAECNSKKTNESPDALEELRSGRPSALEPSLENLLAVFSLAQSGKVDFALLPPSFEIIQAILGDIAAKQAFLDQNFEKLRENPAMMLPLKTLLLQTKSTL